MYVVVLFFGSVYTLYLLYPLNSKVATYCEYVISSCY